MFLYFCFFWVNFLRFKRFVKCFRVSVWYQYLFYLARWNFKKRNFILIHQLTKMLLKKVHVSWFIHKCTYRTAEMSEMLNDILYRKGMVIWDPVDIFILRFWRKLFSLMVYTLCPLIITTTFENLLQNK